MDIIILLVLKCLIVIINIIPLTYTYSIGVAENGHSRDFCLGYDVVTNTLPLIDLNITLDINEMNNLPTTDELIQQTRVGMNELVDMAWQVKLLYVSEICLDEEDREKLNDLQPLLYREQQYSRIDSCVLYQELNTLSVPSLPSVSEILDNVTEGGVWNAYTEALLHSVSYLEMLIVKESDRDFDMLYSSMLYKMYDVLCYIQYIKPSNELQVNSTLPSEYVSLTSRQSIYNYSYLIVQDLIISLTYLRDRLPDVVQ